MTKDQSQPHRSRIFLRRRLLLLASVAGISAAVILAGPMGYGRIQLPAWTSAARAAETQQQTPAGFADLVAKVKPAVISVRVQMDETSRFA